MSDVHLQQQIEALVFASEEAVNLQTVRHVLGIELDAQRLGSLVESLNAEYDATGRSFQIHSLAGGYRFLARAEFSELIKKLLAPKIRKKLSRSLFEVLAVIAYNQPVTRVEIQRIRGVSPDYAIDRLLLSALVEVRGRADSPGKPLQYGTTSDFLDFFHLSSLKELPKLREIQEIFREQDEQEYFNRSEVVEAALSDNNQDETIGTNETEQQRG